MFTVPWVNTSPRIPAQVVAAPEDWLTVQVVFEGAALQVMAIVPVEPELDDPHQISSLSALAVPSEGPASKVAGVALLPVIRVQVIPQPATETTGPGPLPENNLPEVVRNTGAFEAQVTDAVVQTAPVQGSPTLPFVVRLEKLTLATEG